MIYPWKRFWCKTDGAYHLEPSGYLQDPEDSFSRITNPDVLPLGKVHLPCIALLGEPGIGKTKALENERANIENAISDSADGLLWIDLKEYGDEDHLLRDLFESNEFKSWSSSDYTLHVFLDSLDECRIYIPNVVNLLKANLLKHAHQLERLRFRIACRTADWPKSLQELFVELWGKESVGVFELAPLRLKDVIVAAQTEGLDADAFIEAVAQKSAQPLAIKPITLRMLLRIFHRDGRLPPTQIDVYEQGLMLLCEDPSSSPKISEFENKLG